MANTITLEGFTAEFEASFDVDTPVRLESFSAEFDKDFLLSYPVSIEGFNAEFPGEGFTYDYSVPEITSLGTINGEQYTQGQTDVEINWPTTTTQAASGEFLGSATGSGVTFPILGANIPSSGNAHEIGQVMEVTGYSGIDTTLTSSASSGDTTLEITAGTPIVDSAIELWGQTQKEFAQVKSVDGLTVTLHLPLQHDHRDILATVKGVSVSQKTETTDYTIDRVGGSITTIAGQFTSPNDIFIRYSTASADIDHYELYIMPGDHPLAAGVSRAELIAHADTTEVTSSIDSALSQYIKRQDLSDAGDTYTFYFLSVDSKGNPSTAQALAIDMIPPLILNMSVELTGGENVLTWDSVDGSNVDGVNIYRCIGTWNSATSIKLNSSLITDSTFVDGVSNIVNRVSSSTAAYPYGGSNMQYKGESEDTSAPNWDTGTQNETTGQSEILIATITPSYTPATIPPFV